MKERAEAKNKVIKLMFVEFECQALGQISILQNSTSSVPSYRSKHLRFRDVKKIAQVLPAGK